MKGHQDIQRSFYDYLEGTLDQAQRASIEQHLRSCTACAGNLGRLREALSLVPRPDRSPAEMRTEEFWTTFAAGVEQQIERRKQRSTRLADLWDAIHSYLFFRRGSFALAGMAVAIALLAIVLVNRIAPTHEVVVIDSSRGTSIPLEPGNETALQTIEEPSRSLDGLTELGYTPAALERPLRVQYADNRMSQYLRKSKMLLIGVTNLDPDEYHPVNLSVERRASRELVREARYLKQRPLDPRVNGLVDAMSRIMIELANLSEDEQLPNMEIVRSGIHQENLLFKIRMAEAVYDSAQLVYSKGKLR